MNDQQVEFWKHESSVPARRDFLRQAAALSGGVALLGLTGAAGIAQAATVMRAPNAAVGWALELDRSIVGYLQSVEGGFPHADVVTQVAGPGYSKKHIAGVRYQDLVIQLDLPLTRPLQDWVAAALNLTPQRRSGAIVALGMDGKEAQRLQFNNAAITEVIFPACDAAGRQPDFLTLRLSPESTLALGGGAPPAPAAVMQKAGASRWLASNFQLAIPGVDCSGVSGIEAFGMKQMLQADAIGTAREPVKTPGRAEFSNLTVLVAESRAAGFYAWFQDMVVKGNSTEANERQASLQLLGPDLRTVIQTVAFGNLGIFGYTPVKAMANDRDQFRKVKVELYCERMTLATAG